MRPSFVAVAIAFLTLSACQTTGSPQLGEGKTVSALWTGLKTASVATSAAVHAGLIVPGSPKALAVKADLDKARDLISDVDNTYHTSPATDVTSEVATVAVLLSDVLCIVKPTPGCTVSTQTVVKGS